jgi:hypothetical protein
MSTRSNSNKSNSNKSNSSSTSRTQQTPTATIQTSTSRQTSGSQSTAQVTTQTTPATSTSTRRARKPMTIRVRATGEEIRRVPVQRSGYAVVRYGGYYHTVRGGGRTALYILGSEDSEDMLGRA